MYPLTSAGTVKALLPVGNRPLISYPLRNLAEAGIKNCIVVALGEAVCSSISSYLAQQEAAGGVACQVVTVPEESGTADALRAVAPRLTAPSVVVYSGDIVTDLHLPAVLLEHQVSGALATVLVGERKTSPASETKPGKPPRAVDYLGVDASRQLLLFAASSPEALRDIKLPLAAVSAVGAVDLHTDLLDQHMYVLSRPALKLLTAKTNLSSLKLDFMPWLTRHCLKATAAAAAGCGSGGGSNARPLSFGGSGLHPSLSPAELALARHGSGFLLSGGTGSGSFSNIAAAGGPAAAGAAAAAAGGDSAAAAAGSNAGAGSGQPAAAGAGAAAAGGNVAASSTAGSMAGDPGEGEDADGWTADVGMGLPGVLTGLGLPGEGYMALSHAGAAAASAAVRAGRVGVHMVPPGRYCARVNSVQAFGEVNRDVAAADTALQLTGLSPSKYDNVVPPSVSLGAKATVGPSCIMGEDCVVGDKTSVKRSVIGSNCRLGAGVKVINCVLMDDVSVGDGSHIQNCVVCSGAVIQERATLKDCQVGPGFVVAQASDHKSEALAKT